MTNENQKCQLKNPIFVGQNVRQVAKKVLIKRDRFKNMYVWPINMRSKIKLDYNIPFQQYCTFGYNPQYPLPHHQIKKRQRDDYAKRMRQRRPNAAWKIGRPWLQFKDDSTMFCSYCADAKMKCAFAVGCKLLRIDFVKGHEMSLVHQSAVSKREAAFQQQSQLDTSHENWIPKLEDSYSASDYGWGSQ